MTPGEPVAEAGNEERIACTERREHDLLESHEGAVEARGVQRVREGGWRRRILHRQGGGEDGERHDGVAHDVVIEVAVAQHPLHDVGERAFPIRPVPPRDQRIGFPGRGAHELVEPVGAGRERGQDQPRPVRLRHDERLAVSRALDLVGARADVGVGRGIRGEQHFDAAVGAAVQHHEIPVSGRLDVHPHRLTAQQGAARPQPDMHRLPGRRRHGRSLDLQQNSHQRGDHGTLPFHP